MNKNLLLQRIGLGLAVWLFFFALAGCKKKEEAPAPAPESAAAPAAASPAKRAGERAPQSAPEQKRRKVIVTRSMNLEVQNYQVALEALTRLAESSGGYLFKSNRQSNDDNVTSGEVGLRIPPRAAGTVLAQIGRLGTVTREQAAADDITQEYVDLEARIKNAKASEARLLALFKQAGDLGDVLVVERELSRVRGEIEGFEAKRNNWDLLVELATIDIHINEPQEFPSAARLWLPLKRGVAVSLEGLVGSLHALIIVGGALLPWAVFLGPFVYLFVRRLKRVSGREDRPRTPDVVEPDEGSQ